LSPCDRIGIIEGKTLSPSFLTSSPSDLPATCKVATHRKIKNTIHLHRYEIEHEIGQT
jgi:hypothetical protein